MLKPKVGARQAFQETDRDVTLFHTVICHSRLAAISQHHSTRPVLQHNRELYLSEQR